MKKFTLLAFLLVLTMMGILPQAALAAAWADDANIAWYDEQDYYFYLDTPQELAGLAKLVNDGITFEDKTVNIKTGSPINLGADPSKEWTAIGTSQTPFLGTFNGNGNSISGLYSNSDEQYHGLFGYIGQEGRVEDVNLSGELRATGTASIVGGLAAVNAGMIYNCTSNITIDASGTSSTAGGLVGINQLSGSIYSSDNINNVNGKMRVGGLVGQSFGLVKNSSNSGNISQGNITGGLVGDNDGTIFDSTNEGLVEGNGNVGGLAGVNGGMVLACNNQAAITADGANIAGGLLGLNIGSLSNSYNTGSVTGKNISASMHLGGLVGYNESSGTISNCYSSGASISAIEDNNAQATLGGIAGINNADNDNISYNYWLQTGAASGIGQNQNNSLITPYLYSFTDTDGGTLTTSIDINNYEGTSLLKALQAGVTEDDHLAWIAGTGAYTYPILITNWSENTSAITATDGIYKIETAAELAWVAQEVNNNNLSEATFKLSNDIDLQNLAWTPIGNEIFLFKGKFDGGNFEVSGLYIDDMGLTNVGLFGFINHGAIVQNLGVDGSVTAAASNAAVGGLVGQNISSDIINCYNLATVTAQGAAVSAGGIAGGNSGNILNSYNGGNISGTEYSGGLAGIHESSGTVENCYNIGTVKGQNYVGSLLGAHYNNLVKNSYWLAGTATKAIGYTENTPYNTPTTSNIGSFGSVDSEITNLIAADNTIPTGSLFDALNAGVIAYNGSNPASAIKAAQWRIVDGQNKGYPLQATDWRDYAKEPTKDASGIYQIAEAEELAWLIDNHASTGSVGSGGSDAEYILTANINLTEHVWTPIGTLPSFAGSFDGDGHFIEGLYMYNTEASQALFDEVHAVGEIKNLDLSGSVTGVNKAGNNSGIYFTGGLVAENYGTIINCSFDGTVKGYNAVGGLIGHNYNSGRVINSYTNATVTGNSGVGGLMGFNSGTLMNTYSIGQVTGTVSLGGIVGVNSGTVASGYWLQGIANAGIGENKTDIGATASDITPFTAASTATLLENLNNNASDYNKTTPTPPTPASSWLIKSAENNGYPVFATFWQDNTDDGGINWAGFDITINNEGQFAHFASLVNGGNDFQYQTITLAKDLNLSGHVWTAIGTTSSTFKGTFDGAGHKISGLQNKQGLFGVIGIGGIVKNLAVDGNVTGTIFAGGLASENHGTVVNCSYSGTLTGTTHIGGLVGRNDGSVLNCYNSATVSGVNNVGGLTGTSIDYVKNSYNIGLVSASDANPIIGNLVGSLASGSIENSYWLSGKGAVSGVGSVNLSTFKNIYSFSSAASPLVLDATITGNTADNTIPTTGLLEALNAGTTMLNGSDNVVPADYWKAASPYPVHGVKGILEENINRITNGTHGQPLPLATLTNIGDNYGEVVRTTYIHEGIELSEDSDAAIYNNTLIIVETATHRGMRIANFEIGKADFKGATATSVIVNNVAASLTLDLTPFVASLGEGVTYELPAGSSARMDGNILTTTGISSSYPITVKHPNYNEFTFTVNTTTTTLTIPTISVEDIITTYNGTAITIDNFAKDSGNISGDWAIEGSAPLNLTDANNGLWLTLKFSPTGDDANTYSQNYTTALLTIDKALPQGKPSFSAINEAGSILSDVNIRLNDILDVNGDTLDGIFAWQQSTDSDITDGTAYSWTFTPYDPADPKIANNYAVLSDSHLFFRTTPTTGGGGGGGGGGGVAAPDDVIDHGDALDEGDLQELIDDSESLTVKGDDDLEVKFDSAALAAILAEAEQKTITFIAQEASPDDLNAAQTITIGDNFVLDLRVLVDGVEFTDFKSGKVSISLPYQLKDGETAANIKVYYVDAEGNKTLIDSSYADGVLTFVTDHFSLYMVVYEEAAAEWLNPFSDVEVSDWFYADIMYVNQNGIMAGTSATTFAPQSTATRAMIWTVLARLSEAETEGGEPWYALAQAWAIENAVSDGENPNGSITREQLVTMLYRYAAPEAVTGQTMLAQFSDSQNISEWAVAALEWAVANGIISGKDNNLLDPQGQATRAEIAAIIHRFMTM